MGGEIVRKRALSYIRVLALLPRICWLTFMPHRVMRCGSELYYFLSRVCIVAHIAFFLAGSLPSLPNHLR